MMILLTSWCRRRARVGLALLGVGLWAALPLAAAEGDAERVALAVEALTRMEGVDLSANAALGERVLKVLDKTRGTPGFLRLVQHFQLKGQEEGLLELAVAQPASETGVDAIRLVLAGGETNRVRRVLDGTNGPAALRLAEALGNAGRREAVAFLLPLAADAARDGALRRQAVRSLARTQDGARALLGLAAEDRLGEDLKFAAAEALRASRWPELQAAGARLLPRIPGSQAPPLPPVAELARRTGDAANGARLFARATPGCINCHVVRGQGMELGPELSEIGGKLGKDALYESILDPSAGISFGYEGWTVTLKGGDELYGLVASETADELTLKAVGGIVTRVKKAEVASRRQSRLSIMPAGLHLGLSEQELVDLVEYLASLKKP
jgi:putative heme-binding domain-containing protein